MRNDDDKLRHSKSLSIEEQHQEASQDDTGRLRRYLRLAEKLLETDKYDNQEEITSPLMSKAA
jgi:hypothetical protein